MNWINNQTFRTVLESFTIASSLTVIGIIGLLFGGVITHDHFDKPLNVLEIFAVWTSFACTYLCVIQSRQNYWVGVITTAAYAWFFWQTNLLGSAVLQLYLIPTLIYGWFIWGPDKDTRPVEHVAPNKLPLYLGVSLSVFLGAFGIITWFGGQLAPLDAGILIGSILAQFLLDRKKIETWYIWAAVNVISIYTYWNAEAYFAAFQYVIFLGNTLLGFFSWRSTMRTEQSAFA